MSDAWDVVHEEVRAIDHDPRIRETRVRVGSGTLLVVKGTQAIRAPTPLPAVARIVRASRVVLGEAAVLTLSLSSGDTVQVAGSGLAVRAA
jgi:hypothetical protein